jgi:hypothetical protein
MSATPSMPARRDAIAAVLGAVAAPGLPAAMPASRPAGADGFDFLLGAWRVRHRMLARRLAGSTDWIEFGGTVEVRPILGGLGNVDENGLDDPAGRYAASSLRLFDPATSRWSIHWFDPRMPAQDPPVVGRFDGPEGRFFADDAFEGRPIRVRFVYRDLGAGRAHWSQAFCAVGGARWETNWTMDFTRA